MLQTIGQGNANGFDRDHSFASGGCIMDDDERLAREDSSFALTNKLYGDKFP